MHLTETPTEYSTSYRCSLLVGTCKWLVVKPGVLGDPPGVHGGRVLAVRTRYTIPYIKLLSR